MYCQFCGTECQPGLNYCNRCGAAVSTSQLQKQEIAPLDISGPVRIIGVTVCLTTLIGFAILFIGVSGLASWNVGTDPLMATIMVGLLTILGIDISLIRILSRLINTAQGGRRPLLFKKPASNTSELPPAQHAPALHSPGASVTEHTTRTFAPVYKEPRG